MTQFLHKAVRRAACFFLAALLLIGSVFMFTSCQSSWPKVTISIRFNGTTYHIEYRLYRKFFPSTVQHFLELADAGYYDGLCFHDYDEAVGMFTGGYTYDDALREDTKQGLVERDYQDWIEENNVSLTQTVFEHVDDGLVPDESTGLNTVVGEFSQNNYTIENNDKNYGALKEGALVMYYYNEQLSGVTSSAGHDDDVTVRRNTRRATDREAGITGNARWYETRNYRYNSATSLFYISFESNSSVETEYCVFGELYDDDAEEEYEELMSAIESYIEKNDLDGEDEDDPGFTEETDSLPILQDDWYYADYNLTAVFEVPVEPIVIQRIRVNRY